MATHLHGLVQRNPANPASIHLMNGTALSLLISCPACTRPNIIGEVQRAEAEACAPIVHFRVKPYVSRTFVPGLCVTIVSISTELDVTSAVQGELRPQLSEDPRARRYSRIASSRRIRNVPVPGGTVDL